MVFAHYAFEYADIFSIADLDDELAASLLDVAPEHRVTILCHPDDVCRESRD